MCDLYDFRASLQHIVTLYYIAIALYQNSAEVKFNKDSENYQNEWVVKINGGEEMSTLLALRSGYIHIGPVSEFYIKFVYVHYRSKLWDHLFFDDYINYLNFNSVNDKICSFNELNAIKILYKMTPE